MLLLRRTQTSTGGATMTSSRAATVETEPSAFQLRAPRCRFSAGPHLPCPYAFPDPKCRSHYRGGQQHSLIPGAPQEIEANPLARSIVHSKSATHESATPAGTAFWGTLFCAALAQGGP